MSILKKGEFTQTGVQALGDGGSTEYFNQGGRFIRRRWNIDGTVAHDDLISEAEYKEATNAVQVPSPGSVLQREPKEAGSPGSERGGVESGLEGEEAPPAS